MRRVAAFVVAIVGALSAAPAWSQPAAYEIAIEADAINQEHCADLYTSKVDQAASATLAVAEIWQRVDQFYTETNDPSLLFWRGVLAQCLGRDEAALTDLQAFVDEYGDVSMYSDMARQAKTRLRRLSGGGPVGQGPSAAWLRSAHRLEIDVGYGAGGGVDEMACTDSEAGALVINSVCLGGSAAAGVYSGLFAPVGVHARVDAFLARFLGLGARVTLDWAMPTNTPTARDPGATLMVAVGPQLRLLNSVASGGRAGWFRLEVRFAAAFGSISPWSGSKYRSMGFLDAGTWAVRHVGPAAWISGGFEISPKLFLEVGGWFAYYPRLPGTTTGQSVEGSPVDFRFEADQSEDLESEPTRVEDVVVLPEVVGTDRMGWGGRFALIAPVGKGVALGPFIGVDVNAVTLHFPNDPSDIWPLPIVPLQTSFNGTTREERAAHVNTTIDCDHDGDDACRKVFSTRRLDLVGRVGFEVRFGVGAAE